jgi:hypothetical protein
MSKAIKRSSHKKKQTHKIRKHHKKTMRKKTLKTLKKFGTKAISVLDTLGSKVSNMVSRFFTK